MSNKINFIPAKGMKEKYDKVRDEEKLFFAEDTKEIILNGQIYGNEFDITKNDIDITDSIFQDAMAKRRAERTSNIHPFSDRIIKVDYPNIKASELFKLTEFLYFKNLEDYLDLDYKDYDYINIQFSYKGYLKLDINSSFMKPNNIIEDIKLYVNSENKIINFDEKEKFSEVLSTTADKTNYNIVLKLKKDDILAKDSALPSILLSFGENIIYDKAGGIMTNFQILLSTNAYTSIQYFKNSPSVDRFSVEKLKLNLGRPNPLRNSFLYLSYGNTFRTKSVELYDFKDGKTIIGEGTEKDRLRVSPDVITYWEIDI